jgi:hypothetical protein
MVGVAQLAERQVVVLDVVGSSPIVHPIAMSQNIEDTVKPTLGVTVFVVCGLVGAGWLAGGLVVAAGVEGELSEQFAGGGVDDADAQVADQEQDVGSGVGSPDADVVQAAVHPVARVPSLIRSLATSAIGLPVSLTSRTAPSRKSGSNFLRVSAIAVLP